MQVSDENEFDLRGFFSVLRRHLKLMFIVFVVVISAAFFYIFSLTPVYTASTLILVEPASKNALASEAGPFQSPGLNSIRVDGEIEVLRSDAVALRVVEKAALLSDPEFGIPQDAALNNSGTSPEVEAQFLLKTVIQNFRQATSVSRKGQTYLITASVNSVNPVRAAELANIYANAYIDHQISSKIESLQNILDILMVKQADARKALEESETALDRFIAENIALIGAQTGRSDLLALQQSYLSLTAQSLQTSARVQQLAASLQQKDWATLAASLQNDTLLEMERQRAQLAAGLAGAAAGSQTSLNIRTELANLDKALALEATAAQGGLQTELARLQTQARAAQAQIRGSVLQGDLPPELLTEIYSLQQDANITRAQYDNFQSRLRELQLQTEIQMADSRVVSPALPPIYPSSQSNRATLILAGVFGAMLAMGLAFLNEFFIGGFTSEAQLAHALQLPVGARIPAVTPIKPPDRQGAIASVAEVYASQPLSGYAESIRRLRVALDQSLQRRKAGAGSADKKCDVIMVTSTVPGEGKSNTGLALGRTYAGSGLRTLLIDCDLRKPRIHRLLGAEPSAGMMHFLMNDAAEPNLGQMAATDYASKLKIMPGAGRSDVPTDQLLAGPRFAALMQFLKAEFDVIILDTPPLLPLVDALYLSHHADAIALVVKWASTAQQDVKSVLPALFEAKDPGVDVLAVLSQERSGKLGYYRKYAAYYQSATGG